MDVVCFVKGVFGSFPLNVKKNEGCTIAARQRATTWDAGMQWKMASCRRSGRDFRAFLFLGFAYIQLSLFATCKLTLGRAPRSAWRLSWNRTLWLPRAMSTSAIFLWLHHTAVRRLQCCCFVYTSKAVRPCQTLEGQRHAFCENIFPTRLVDSALDGFLCEVVMYPPRDGVRRQTNECLTLNQ